MPSNRESRDISVPAIRRFQSTGPGHEPGRRSLAIDVEVEPLVVDLLEGTVGTDRGDRIVELVHERGIALADRNTDAFAVPLRIGNRLAHKMEALAIAGLQPVAQDRLVGEREVGTAR